MFDEKDVLFSGDMDNTQHNINSGVLVVKASSYGEDIISFWMSEQQCKKRGKEKYPQWNDQSCIRVSLDDDVLDLRRHSHIIPFGTLQTFGHLFPHPHPLIRHFPNINAELRKMMLNSMT